MALVAQLYPRGRAFKIIIYGFKDSLHLSIAKKKALLISDIVSTFDSTIPDNVNFSTDDATLWEKRLGLITNPSVILSDRKKAIIRKMNYPGGQPARQHFLFIQSQLQLAGFNVFVNENRFPDGSGGYFTQDPVSLSGSAGGANQHGDRQHGDAQHGTFFTSYVANSIDQSVDASFDIGYNLRSTFFIGGYPVGTSATVAPAREKEFRQLILKLKPAQTVAYLFITYS